MNSIEHVARAMQGHGDNCSWSQVRAMLQGKVTEWGFYSFRAKIKKAGGSKAFLDAQKPVSEGKEALLKTISFNDTSFLDAQKPVSEEKKPVSEEKKPVSEGKEALMVADLVRLKQFLKEFGGESRLREALDLLRELA